MDNRVCRRCLRTLMQHSLKEAIYCARPMHYVSYKYDHHRFGPTYRSAKVHEIEIEDGKITTILYLAGGGYVSQADFVSEGELVNISPVPLNFD